MRRKTLRSALVATLVVFAAACAGDADTGDAEGTGSNAEGGSILPPGGDTAAVGDMGTGTGETQSGGELTGEVPDSAAGAAGGTTP